MLALSFDELKLIDLEKYSFNFGGNKCLRFCIDVTHLTIILCESREDHLTGAELWLANEQNISKLEIDQVAENISNHIVGAGLYTDHKKPDEAFILLY